MHIFTDGSCINNGKKNSKGGIGVFFGDNDTKNVSQELTCEKM
jgi:ribonuclease HI